MNPLSGVFGEAWRTYRAHAGHLIGIAFVIFLPAAVLDYFATLTKAGILFLGTLILMLAMFLVQAALTKSAQDLRDGQADLSIGKTVGAAVPVLLPVIVVGLLAGFAISIGLDLLIVPGLFLITIWAVIIPVVVIEQPPMLSAFGRSRQLVRGRGWNVFGTLVTAIIILILVNLVLGFLLFALPLGLRNGVATVVSGSLVAPFIVLVVTDVYYRLVASTPPVRV
jgi:hypothetical protein